MGLLSVFFLFLYNLKMSENIKSGSFVTKKCILNIFSTLFLKSVLNNKTEWQGFHH